MMKTLQPRRLGLATSAWILAALPVRAEVWTVDGSLAPGSDFTTIQAAVDAASDGDTLLVHSWEYQPFLVDGKGLTVVTVGQASKLGGLSIFGGTSEPAFVVRNLAASQEVIVRGFTSPYGVLIEDCAGGVWVEDFHSDVVDLFGFCSMGGTHGAEVRNSARVTFSRCTLRGENAGGGIGGTMPSADGVAAESSTVHLFDCVVTGGWGDDEGASGPNTGGAGLRLTASTAAVSGSAIHGGAGGVETTPFGTVCDGSHADGGPGVEFAGAGSALRRTDSVIAGGFADLDALCPGVTGPAGPDLAGAGQVVDLPGAAHHLTVNSPTNSGEPLTFELGGAAGEAAAVLVSLGHHPLPFPAPAGVLLVDLSTVSVLHGGRLSPGGTATISFPSPHLGLLEGLSLYAQAAFVDASPASWLGAGSALTLLDLP